MKSIYCGCHFIYWKCVVLIFFWIDNNVIRFNKLKHVLLLLKLICSYLFSMFLDNVPNLFTCKRKDNQNSVHDLRKDFYRGLQVYQFCGKYDFEQKNFVQMNSPVSGLLNWHNCNFRDTTNPNPVIQTQLKQPGKWAWGSTWRNWRLILV